MGHILMMYQNIHGYKSYTLDNFAIDLKFVHAVGGAGTTNRTEEFIEKNYDADNGIFSFTILKQVKDETEPYLKFDVCLFYVEY